VTYDRADLDWYQEPRFATEGLLRVETFEGPILDPACGSGNIVEACLAAGLAAYGSDIKQRTDAAWFKGERDFLQAGPSPRARDLITNPPFFRAKGTEAFIRKALVVACGKVAIFTDVKFLAGQGRARGLFKDHPPSRVWIITPRPSCPPGAHLVAGGVASGGTADWCWLVWDEKRAGESVLGWIRA
jgi:hypothetical protein